MSDEGEIAPKSNPVSLTPNSNPKINKFIFFTLTF